MPDLRETAAELISRFQYAEAYRKQYDQRAIENYKLYTGYRPPLPKELKGRSNLHIPKTYELVDSLRARYLRAIFAANPVIEYIPNPLLYFQEGLSPESYLQLLMSAEDSAKYSTYLVDQQLRNSRVYRKFYDFITSVLVFPAGILAVGWKFEQRLIKQRQKVFNPELGIEVEAVLDRLATVYDDNDVQYVDYYDFWPDPRGTDLDNCRFVFHREWCTEQELRAKLEVLARAGSGKVYEPEDWEALVAAGAALQGGASERMAEIGLAAETGQGHWSDIRRGYQIELLHYWEDDRHAIIANRTEIVFDGQNPYWHGKKPFVCTSFDPRPGEFYGFSAVEIIEHLQHELNTNRNQRIDNVSFVLNRMWKVRRGADIDESELVSRPHGVVWVDNPDDVTDLTTPDVTASSYNEENIIKQDMDNVLGVPAVVRGVDPERKQTATEIVTKGGAADMKFQVKVMLYETVLERLAELLDMNNQQFIDGPRIFRIEDEWKVVTPEELRGHHLYRPASSNLDVTANREIRRQQVLELQKILQGSQFVDQYELLKLVLQTYGIRGTEKLLLPKDQAMMGQLPGQMPGQMPPGAGMPTSPGVPQQILATIASQAMQGGGGGAL